MTHNTPSRTEAKELKQRASELIGESRALEGIEGAALLAGEREAEAARLQEQACELEDAARLEDITVWEDCIVKQTKRARGNTGDGWRAGGKAASCARYTWEAARGWAERRPWRGPGR